MAKLTLEERFWSKVDKRGPDDCWPWLAGQNGNGYGSFWAYGKNRYATHVALYLATRKMIPDSTVARHTCDNPGCVNPAHLIEGTKGDNNRDRSARGRSADRHGEKHPLAKLTWKCVDEIRRLYALGDVTQEELARVFGVARGTIEGIVLGKRWVRE
jgi:hypothetical protein